MIYLLKLYALVRNVLQVVPTGNHDKRKNTPPRAGTSVSGCEQTYMHKDSDCEHCYKTSYRLTHSGTELPYLNISLVNRQTYTEASVIFYKYNTFDFYPGRPPHDLYGNNSTRTRIQTCLDFLSDRPQHALQHVYEIRLCVVDYAGG